jgi:hypothetical protein
MLWLAFYKQMNIDPSQLSNEKRINKYKLSFIILSVKLLFFLFNHKRTRYRHFPRCFIAKQLIQCLK